MYRWINVVIELHGSCAGFSEGLCGVWNGDKTDDLFRSANENAEKYRVFDVNCPPPPIPFRPCDNIDPDRKAKALATCSKITGI